MVSTILKLILSLTAGGVCLWQHDLQKPIASLFCFILCVMLFLAFILDVISLIRGKKSAGKAEEEKTPVKAPVSGDYPDSPDPSDLKIGKTFRAVDVNRFVEHIHSLGEENPDYGLSESELIDNYLTDKKIWKYIFKIKNVSLKATGAASIGIFAGDLQIGSIRPLDCPLLLTAMKTRGVEVVYCTIGGGPYKIITEDVVTGQYNMIEQEQGYSVTLSIYQK